MDQPARSVDDLARPKPLLLPPAHRDRLSKMSVAAPAAPPSPQTPEIQQLPPVPETPGEPTAGMEVDGWRPAPWWRRRGATPLFVGADTAAALTAALVLRSTALEAAILVVVFLVAIHANGLHQSRLTLSALDDLPRILVSGMVAVAAAGLIVTLSGPTWRSLDLMLVLVAAGFAYRAVSYGALYSLRRRGMFTHQTLILGAGRVGADLARTMQEHPEHGLLPVGFIDASPMLDRDLPVPVLGTPGDLASRIVANHVEHVVIAFTATREMELVDAVRTCDRLRCEISVVPRLFELIPRTSHTDELNGTPLVRLHRATFRSVSWLLKRAFDVVLSLIALLVLGPVLLAVAALVRIVDGPDVIFRQQRVGMDGKLFELLKFRSLRPESTVEGDEQWNVKGDARMSGVGAFIRRTSLDELPQLFNILGGDMSIVGPRPERPFFVSRFSASLLRYDHRHRVPCGLTGWAQIHGMRGDTSIEERARLDNYYIENWSLWLDFKIIVRTIPNLMRGSG